jgi:VCBS repeat protein
MTSSVVARTFFTSLVVSLVCGIAAVARAGQPIAPAVTGPDYSVTYNNDYGALDMWLYERYGTGATQYISSSATGETINFTGKPPGDYYYSTTEMFVYYDEYYFPYYYYWNSPLTHVIVTGASLPNADPLSIQNDYTYETRSGDFNGDGLLDLFVHRTSGGTSGNGSIENVILERLANGAFTHVVPTAGQASAATGWPAVAVDLVLSDFNLDGFMDIVLNNLGNVLSGAVGQIVVAPGVTGALQGLVPMDAKYNKFTTEVGNFLEDPNWYYYDAIAHGRYNPVYQWHQYCIIYPYWDENGYYWEYADCWWEYEFVGYYVDYSSYDQDGRELAGAIGVGSDGWPVPDVAPGTAAARTIDQVLQRVFGVRFMKGQLDYPCSYALAYDSDMSIPCENDTIGEIVLGQVMALTERGDCRYLTLGEMSQLPLAGFSIRNVFAVRVCRQGFLLFFRRSIMSPNGNVYVGPGSRILSWYEDYSPMQEDMSNLVHELFHVYQYRNLGCQLVCMTTRKIGAFLTGGYHYKPIDWGKTFWQHNMEQQAQMVGERYFIRRSGIDPYTDHDNLSVTLTELNAMIPTPIIPPP